MHPAVQNHNGRRGESQELSRLGAVEKAVEKTEHSVDRLKKLCYYSKRNPQVLIISYRDRCPQGLNREVRCNAGAVPPLYWGANPSYTTGMKILGRFGRAMIQSQENCLFDNHRFTHARWGGDFDAAPALELLPGIFAGIFYEDQTVHAVSDSLL